MKKMTKIATGFVCTAALLMGTAGTALAYEGAEYGTKNCSGGNTMATKVRADGSHRHTQNGSTKDYPNVGYVRNTYWSANDQEGSYYIAGGIGYYSYNDSYGYCAN